MAADGLKGRGIRPDAWGACAWKTLHFIMLAYPERPCRETVARYRAFVTSFGQVLPCKKCRDNFARHLNASPPDDALRRGGDAAFLWSAALHNAVSADKIDKIGKIGKPDKPGRLPDPMAELLRYRRLAETGGSSARLPAEMWVDMLVGASVATIIFAVVLKLRR